MNPATKQPEFTPEEIEKAKLYTTNLVHEIEKALIGEIEKLEGHVPDNVELSQHGTQILHKDLSMDYYWKGRLLVRVKPQQIQEGKRGTLIEIHSQGITK